MKLREFEIFRAIIRAGSITDAAVMLHVSQPAISKTLAALEAQLGIRLFRRAHGRLEATPEALRLYPEVDRLFGAFDAVQRFASDLRESHSGLLRPAASPTLSYAFLSEAITRFQIDSPAVRVSVQVLTTREIIRLAGENQIDFGLIHAPTETPSLAVRRLFEAEMVCVMPDDHPLASKQVVGPADVSRYPLIANTTSTIASRTDEAFRACGLEPNVAISANNTMSVYAIVAAGGGVAIVDPWIRHDLYPRLARRPFRPRIGMTVRIVQSRAKPPSRLVLRFLDVLDEVIANRRCAYQRDDAR
ncbi:MAG: LysR substrate-binding domain-containing protein [Casimicrobiaceae bacterium]